LSAAAIVALLARLGEDRALRVVVQTRSSRSSGNARNLLVRLPHVVKSANSERKATALIAESSKPVVTDAVAVATKVVINLRFDAMLLAKVNAAAKRQGITRTAWLHRAAFDALGE
jgi:hypothetical protein